MTGVYGDMHVTVVQLGVEGEEDKHECEPHQPFCNCADEMNR